LFLNNPGRSKAVQKPQKKRRVKKKRAYRGGTAGEGGGLLRGKVVVGGEKATENWSTSTAGEKKGWRQKSSCFAKPGGPVGTFYSGRLEIKKKNHPQGGTFNTYEERDISWEHHQCGMEPSSPQNHRRGGFHQLNCDSRFTQGGGGTKFLSPGKNHSGPMLGVRRGSRQ